MHKVTVDPENKTVTAQAGARWVVVDNEAVKYDLACVGATINDTGVAGVSGERDSPPRVPAHRVLPTSLPLEGATGFSQVGMD